MIKKAKNYWEQIYKNKQQLVDWPWSETVGLVKRYFLKSNRKKKMKVLELGFGNGPNIPFFLSQNMDFHGVELSKTIVEKVKKKFPSIRKNITQGNFNLFESYGKNFDLIVDRGAMTHNNSKEANRSIYLAYQCMKKNGIYIGTDWFSVKHSEFLKGSISDDKKTRNNYKDGPFKNVGKVHFFDKKEIKDIFKKWKLLYLSESQTNIHIPNKSVNYSSWTIVAKK